MAHDVVVLGATVAGLTVARRLAVEGFDVVVLDPNLESRSAAIGHGVAALGHASTVANMAHAYGLDAAREHVRRNLAALEEIREVFPATNPRLSATARCLAATNVRPANWLRCTTPRVRGRRFWWRLTAARSSWTRSSSTPRSMRRRSAQRPWRPGRASSTA